MDNYKDATDYFKFLINQLSNVRDVPKIVSAEIRYNSIAFISIHINIKRMEKIEELKIQIKENSNCTELINQLALLEDLDEYKWGKY